MAFLSSPVGRQARKALTLGGVVMLGVTVTTPAPVEAEEAGGGCFWACMGAFGPIVKHSDHYHLYDGCMNIDGLILCFY